MHRGYSGYFVEEGFVGRGGVVRSSLEPKEIPLKPLPPLNSEAELVESRSEAFVGDYLTLSEQARVHEAQGPEERSLRANLIWCGKESALKVLRTGLRRDTRSVEVSFPEAPAVEGWQALLVRATEGAEFPGWWRRFGAFVLTVAASAEIDPPRALVDPPGLANAVPAHQWLRSRLPGGQR